jgi:hypothetical protein
MEEEEEPTGDELEEAPPEDLDLEDLDLEDLEGEDAYPPEEDDDL